MPDYQPNNRQCASVFRLLTKARGGRLKNPTRKGRSHVLEGSTVPADRYFMSRLRYRSFPGGRGAFIAAFGMFGLCVIGLGIALAFSGEAIGPFGAFFVLWVLAFVWNAYWFLARISVELELHDTALVAKCVLSTRTIELGELSGLRPMKMLPLLAVLELPDQRNVTTWLGKGYAEFAMAIAARAPDVPVHLGEFAESLQSAPGFNGFKVL